jgi:hypothetical protein
MMFNLFKTLILSILNQFECYFIYKNIYKSCLFSDVYGSERKKLKESKIIMKRILSLFVQAGLKSKMTSDRIFF